MAIGLNINGMVRPVCLAVVLLASLAGCDEKAGDRTQTVNIDGRTFHLELALDAAAREQGLSDRESIAPDGGMLFVFPHAAERMFVMRRCLVPIDIIFLDPAGRVVAMHEMKVQPYDTPEARLKPYRSQWPAQFAIELPGGTLEKLDIELADVIKLPFDKLVARAK